MDASIINEAIRKINQSAFGRYLLDNFPVRVTTPTQYSEQNKVLEKHGSPACTDGKHVYVSPRIMNEYLEREFKKYDHRQIKAIDEGTDKWWAIEATDYKYRLSRDDKVTEAIDVILHELTHAVNEHTKLSIAASNKSQAYQRKLAVACELQANDGVMGRTYEFNAMQQLPGVTNKRMHQETFGCHTLASIMSKLELTEDEKSGRGGSAQKDSEAQKDMAKATGQYEKIEQEIEQDKKANDQNKGKGDEEDNGENDKPGDFQRDSKPTEGQDTTEKIVNEMARRGLQQIKQLILASLTDELKYDPTSNSVLWNDVRKRVRKQTYARPSRRTGMYGSGQYQVLRKGTKIERVKEPDTANKLTVLAVDASGSMQCQQKYVASIIDDLLKQVKEQAEKLGIEVHYENLLAMMHTTRASEIYQVESDAWKQRMADYRACGGNDFSCVLSKISRELLPAKEYDNITVINVSDGLDILRADHVRGTRIGEYVEQGKVTWLDALVNADPTALREADKCISDDEVHIRKQLLITTEAEKIW